MIEINNLKFKYTYDSTFLDITNVKFEKGNIYGIFGSNGSGKTTLIEIINGLILNFEGDIKTNEKISYLPDHHQYLEWMTINDIVNFYKDFYVDFDEEVFEELKPDISNKILLNKLSKGQREAIFISLVFARDTKIYIMDEPFGALDIYKQDYYIKKIIEIVGEDKLLIMTTHYPYDIQNIFSKVMFMKQGRIISQYDVESYDSIIELYKREMNDVQSY